MSHVDSASTRHLDDGPLIELAATDPHAAFDQLYRRWHKSLLGFITKRCGDLRRAEDICQTTWLKAWRTLPAYRHDGRQYMAYLVTIACNVLRDEEKSSRVRLTLLLDPLPPRDTSDVHSWDTFDLIAPPEPSAEDEAEVSLQAGVLARLEAALVDAGSPEQAETLRLQYLQECPVAVVAERLGLTEPAVKARAYRGRLALRRSATIRRIYSDVYDMEPAGG